MQAREFQRLKEQLQNGDNTPLAWVFEQCGRYCIGTLIQKTNCDQADAEDLLMEAVLIFRQNVVEHKVTEISSIRAYLFGIVWNKWRDLQRARQRWQREQDELGRTLYLRFEEGDPLVRVEEQKALLDQVSQRLSAAKQALSQLKSTCQQILTLFYMEKKPMAEIAEALGFANANVVKVSKHRCYQKWMRGIADLAKAV